MYNDSPNLSRGLVKIELFIAIKRVKRVKNTARGSVNWRAAARFLIVQRWIPGELHLKLINFFPLYNYKIFTRQLISAVFHISAYWPPLVPPACLRVLSVYNIYFIVLYIIIENNMIIYDITCLNVLYTHVYM